MDIGIEMGGIVAPQMVSPGGTINPGTADELMADTALRVNGHTRLARFMAEYPDLAIFRSFRAVSTEILLHRQAELVELEEKLRSSQEADRNSGHVDRVQYALCSDALRASGDRFAEKGNDPRTWDLMLELSGKLREYQQALLLHRDVAGLQRPQSRHLESLVWWMDRPSMGNVSLTGSDHDLWGAGEKSDLVSVAPKRKDGSNSALSLRIAHFYHKTIGRHIHSAESVDWMPNTIIYHDDGIYSVFKTAKTIVACLLPILGIVVLYCVESMTTRLSMIAAFTAVFALCMDQFTNAPIKDIFSATAAFAAVLVVFVGSTKD